MKYTSYMYCMGYSCTNVTPCSRCVNFVLTLLQFGWWTGTPLDNHNRHFYTLNVFPNHVTCCLDPNSRYCLTWTDGTQHAKIVIFVLQTSVVDKRAIHLTFVAWLIMVLHMLIAEETILFPVAVKHIFVLNKYNNILRFFYTKFQYLWILPRQSTNTLS